MIGKTKDSGFQVGARKTFNIDHTKVWDWIISEEALKIWLSPLADFNINEQSEFNLSDGSFGKIRIFKPYSHLRITWKPAQWKRPSLIQIRTIPNGDKTIISFHQEHLPGQKEREVRKKFYLNVLDKIEKKLSV